LGNIVFAAGGTGGHVSPAVALAEAWKELSPDDSLFILGGNRVEEKDFFFPGEHVDIAAPQSPLRPNNWFKLVTSYRCAKKIVKDHQVQAVIGTGGYASFPTLLAARHCKVPYWLLDANQRMGRVVKLLGKKAVKVIGPKGCTEKGQDPLGNPVRVRFEVCERWQHSEGSPFHILVSGGSGGARALDQRLPGILNTLHKTIPLKVTHISRRDAAVAEYEMEASVRPPGPDFLELLQQCHLLIGRAGGSTIAECNAAGRPQVLIPLPTSKDDHQRANAKVQADNKAAIVLEQSQSDEEWLKQLRYFCESKALKEAALSAYNSYPRKLAEQIVEDIRQHL